MKTPFAILLVAALICLSGCCACPVQAYPCPDGSYAPGPELCETPAPTPAPTHTATQTPAHTATPHATRTPTPEPTEEEPAVTPPPGEYAEIEQRIFELTNEDRVGEGLQPLEPMDELANAARWQSCCLAENGLLVHDSPECGTVNDRLLMFGLPMTDGAENIGQVPDARQYYAGTMEPVGLYTDEEVAQRFNTGWMNSPPHRANILDPRLTHLGVGVCKAGHYYYATQNFIISEGG